ncbi:alpha-glucosidase [Neobacillus cucumis]|uniref:glycoside hydrolase family 13 protein n=1 Tax=Neobacillus cucumis TaxID=1740721 RepID=UPI0018DF84C7|nr:alpha-glucosidase [Neobacillus cucumis]MBI0579843.1 alpha-glucosidase [Neobacillus cucumis]
MNSEWWHKSVVYQIYPRSFQDSNGDGIGDLQGIISRLDYIQALGVDMIWLCPVYASPNDDNGYDISDYYSIHPEYGTMEDMEQLISEAANRGIGIMMDIVANHTSDEHPWFIEASKDQNSPYRDYYVWRDQPQNDIQSIFGGSAWEYSKETKQYYLHMFSKKQPDLNWHYPPVRRAIYDVMEFWIEKGIKGFRFDVIDLIAKEIDKNIIANGPLLHPYLKEMYQEVLEGKGIVTVGETGGADVSQALLYTNPDEKELSMVFSFEHIALDEVPGKQKWDLKPLNLDDLKQVNSNWQNCLADKGWNSLFWNNHDQPRIVSRWGNDTEYRYESATMLAALLHLMRGTPYIYQGEEIGMTNVSFTDLSSYRDIETFQMYKERIEKGFSHEEIFESIHAKGRDNARTPMQWNSLPEAGFTKGIPWISVNPNFVDINAEKDRQSEKSIFRFYQKLVNLRKNSDLIVYGDYQLLETEPEIFAYTRQWKNEQLFVFCNFTEEIVDCSLLPSGELFLQNYASSPLAGKLRPYEVVVWKKTSIKF